eukprot:Unigene16150_Nuclearia_a/m.47974 Unigene16150_Nuclearia_a/g.47974  ORF Unigene16150_Nuclearia_a/g.47974 Unigene16150_Nuclearia_a/m.47974 type:complete len:124 (-) Unigene16150_Nuclearia_a:500-871(-)
MTTIDLLAIDRRRVREPVKHTELLRGTTVTVSRTLRLMKRELVHAAVKFHGSPRHDDVEVDAGIVHLGNGKFVLNPLAYKLPGSGGRGRPRSDHKASSVRCRSRPSISKACLRRSGPCSTISQ